VLRERFHIIHQRVLRNDTRKKSLLPVTNNNLMIHQEITPIKNLIGQKGKFRLFGMLSQMVDGQVHLEDVDGCIQLTLNDLVHTLLFNNNQVNSSPGIMCWNSFVVVEGEHTDERQFIVSRIDSPAGESRVETFEAHGNCVDLFSTLKPFIENGILAKIEKRSENAFVFISEVWVSFL